MTLRERFDDGINPIVVKELRQAVRGRFVVTVITLSLAAQLIAVAVLAVTERISLQNVNAQPVGLGAFMTIFTLLFTACIFFVPMYSGFRMASERSDTNVDLLFITTIRTLWHEVIGFLFLSLAFLGALSGVRIVRNFDGSPESLFRLILTTCFVVIMGGYGVSSFLRARRITRS